MLIQIILQLRLIQRAFNLGVGGRPALGALSPSHFATGIEMAEHIAQNRSRCPHSSALHPFIRVIGICQLQNSISAIHSVVRNALRGRPEQKSGYRRQPPG
jgi:hypothetical protein